MWILWILILNMAWSQAARSACDELPIERYQQYFVCDIEVNSEACQAPLGGLALAATAATIKPLSSEEEKVVRAISNSLSLLDETSGRLTADYQQIIDEVFKKMKAQGKIPRLGSHEFSIEDLSPHVSELQTKFPENSVLKKFVEMKKATNNNFMMNDVFQRIASESSQKIATDLPLKIRGSLSIAFTQEILRAMVAAKMTYAKSANTVFRGQWSIDMTSLKEHLKMATSEVKSLRKPIEKYVQRKAGLAKKSAIVGAGLAAEVLQAAEPIRSRASLLSCAEVMNSKPSPLALATLNSFVRYSARPSNQKNECDSLSFSEGLFDELRINSQNSDNKDITQYICNLYNQRNNKNIKNQALGFSASDYNKNDRPVIQCDAVKIPINAKHSLRMNFRNDFEWHYTNLSSDNYTCNQWIEQRIKNNPNFPSYERHKLLHPNLLCANTTSPCGDSLCKLSQALITVSENQNLLTASCHALRTEPTAPATTNKPKTGAN